MGAASPLLTVLVPAYQVAPYLPRCLDSIVATPGDELEVLVVDDHSPDHCGELAQRYTAGDPRVRVVRLPANVGLGRARNEGLRRARGEYVWFVDGDDWLPAGSGAAVLARLRLTRPDVLVLDHAEVFPDGQLLPSACGQVLAGDRGPGPLSARPELLEVPHSACTKVVRREFLDRIGLRFHPGWYEDSAYSHPLLLAAQRIDTLDQVCYLYRQRPAGAITKSVSDRHFEVFAQYERMWRAAARVCDGYAQFAPRLFRLMVDHLLVIAGSDHRLPRSARRAFFGQLVAAYHRWRPPDGYPVPGGLAGLKHRLVRWHAYPAYTALRLARRAAGGGSLPARRFLGQRSRERPPGAEPAP